MAENDRPADPEEPPPSSLWHNPDFLRFWFGETMSLYGTQVTTLALPLTAVLVFDAGPEELGLLRFVQLSPYLLFALLFGVWVDRMRRRRVMIAANASRMVLVGLVPVLATMDLLNMNVLLVLATLIGIAAVWFDVSWMSYVPSLVRDPRSFVEANSKLGITASSAETAGPGIGGALVNAFTAPIAMAVNAATYAVSLASLLLIRTPEPAPTPPEVPRSLLPELKEGLRWVFGDRHLRALALIGFCCNFFMILISSMFVLYAVRDHDLSPATLGLILSMGSVGGLIGALLAGPVVKRAPIGLVYGGSLTAIFLGPMLIPLASGSQQVVVAMFIASFFISYMGLTISNVVIMTLRQTMTPQSLMGRMNAAFRTLLFGGGSLGGPAGGLIAGFIGLRGTLAFAAIGSAVLLIPVYLSPVTRLRALPPRAEEPDLQPAASATP